MSFATRVVPTLTVLVGLMPALVLAQSSVALRASWDHCAGDGRVTEKSFACDSNLGSERAFGSVIFDDGVDRTDVAAIQVRVDFRLTSSNLVPWWATWSGQCRQNSLSIGEPSLLPAGSCRELGELSSSTVISTFAQTQGNEGPNELRLDCVMAWPQGFEATFPAGQEIALFRVSINHSKSTGTGSCAGCPVPVCIGFGELQVMSSTAPTETIVGSPASTLTWQEAHVMDYGPVPGHPEEGGFMTYKGNLSCSTGPVPAQNRTWGMIKTMYR